MKKKNRNPHSKVHDYSKYASKWNGVEIPSDDERYYGIHRDGNRVKIDIKRMKKMGISGVPTCSLCIAKKHNLFSSQTVAQTRLCDQQIQR